MTYTTKLSCNSQIATSRFILTNADSSNTTESITSWTLRKQSWEIPLESVSAIASPEDLLSYVYGARTTVSHLILWTIMLWSSIVNTRINYVEERNSYMSGSIGARSEPSSNWGTVGVSVGISNRPGKIWYKPHSTDLEMVVQRMSKGSQEANENRWPRVTTPFCCAWVHVRIGNKETAHRAQWWQHSHQRVGIIKASWSLSTIPHNMHVST